jgi:hypothetical protein
MTTDLTTIIQDGIAQTLKLLLAKKVTLKGITKAYKTDLKG